MEHMILPPALPNKDKEHLDLLVTFHYVLAAVMAVFSCFPLIHVGLGILMITQREIFTQGGPNAQAPPVFFGFLFALMGGVFVLLGWVAAACTFVSGRWMKQRKNRMFSFVIAGLLCMVFPLGTVLGVFTIIILSRESVKQVYLHG